MVQVKEIKLYRAEGLIEECGPAGPFDSFKAADEKLRLWAGTAPDGGCYDKCDFEIEWTDGETYKGRYDLKRHDVGFVDLIGRHVRDFLTFLTGKRCPGHMEPEDYADLMRRHEADRPGQAAECSAFLKAYEIGV